MIYKQLLPSFIIIIALSITLITNTVVYAQPDFQDLLKKLDADLDHAINMCSKDNIYSSVKERCIDEIEEAWWIDCMDYYDKLDTCKNGKVENFLKSHGRL